MEGMRDIARSYYKQASEADKKSVKEFFEELDVDGDGVISVAEFKKLVAEAEAVDYLFEKLDLNGDRCLDFEEFLCLYYMATKMNIKPCDGCAELLVGPYFSCLLCIRRSAHSYDLCCSCYRHAADFSHEHSSDNMMDHHSLLNLLRVIAADALKSQYKRELEELGVIAKAHYKAGSPQVQALAYEFFQSMDSDSDGSVDLSEFLAFMSRQGYSSMKGPNFFNAFDVDGNGTLDFSEVITLYYVIRSGRPFCDGCSTFIPGIFFSCVHCFKINPKTSFTLCLNCYRSASCDHNHDGRTQFLDNYTLLQAMRDPALAASGVNLNHQASNISLTNAIVPATPSQIIRRSLDLTNLALQLAVNIGNVATNFCTIM